MVCDAFSCKPIPTVRGEGAAVAARLQLLQSFPLWASCALPAPLPVKIHAGKSSKPKGGKNKWGPEAEWKNNPSSECHPDCPEPAPAGPFAACVTPAIAQEHLFGFSTKAYADHFKKEEVGWRPKINPYKLFFSKSCPLLPGTQVSTMIKCPS